MLNNLRDFEYKLLPMSEQLVARVTLAAHKHNLSNLTKSAIKKLQQYIYEIICSILLEIKDRKRRTVQRYFKQDEPINQQKMFANGTQLVVW